MSFAKVIGKAGGIVGGAIGFVATGGNPAGAAAGFAIGGAVGGAVAGGAAEGKERKAAKQQKKLAQLQAMRQRYEYLRGVQTAAAMARVSNMASGAGLESSTLQGIDASLRTTMKDDLGFQDRGGVLADSIYRSMKQADSYRSAANMGAAITSIGSAAMSVMPTGAPTTTATTAPSGPYTPKIETTPQGQNFWNAVHRRPGGP